MISLKRRLLNKLDFWWYFKILVRKPKQKTYIDGKYGRHAIVDTNIIEPTFRCFDCLAPKCFSECPIRFAIRSFGKTVDSLGDTKKQKQISIKRKYHMIQRKNKLLDKLFGPCQFRGKISFEDYYFLIKFDIRYGRIGDMKHTLSIVPINLIEAVIPGYCRKCTLNPFWETYRRCDKDVICETSEEQEAFIANFVNYCTECELKLNFECRKPNACTTEAEQMLYTANYAEKEKKCK